MTDLIKCPICIFSSENLTTHIIKIHNMTVKEFKILFKLNYVQSKRLRDKHSNSINNNYNMFIVDSIILKRMQKYIEGLI